MPRLKLLQRFLSLMSMDLVKLYQVDVHLANSVQLLLESAKIMIAYGLERSFKPVPVHMDQYHECYLMGKTFLDYFWQQRDQYPELFRDFKLLKSQLKVCISGLDGLACAQSTSIDCPSRIFWDYVQSIGPREGLIIPFRVSLGTRHYCSR